MVIDLCFFLNEADLLGVRFNILGPYVDRFIVVESTHTFSGVPKALGFDIGRYPKWKDKITYYVVNDYPNDEEIYKMALLSPCTGAGEEYWLREFYIKESARKALKDLGDKDVVFISDLDEIWNPNIIYLPKDGEVLKPKQIPYLYYFNQRTDEDWLGWSGTICTRYKTIKDGVINHLRTDDMTTYTVLLNGGWHFNSIGGKQKKVDASQHPIVNTAHDWNRREVNMRIDEVDLPTFLLDNKEQWKRLFL